MKRIVFPAGMTSIPSRVCSGCPHLEEAQIPKTVKEIGLYAFSGCHKLKNISLPPNLERVGAEAFEGCQLDSLVFPATVKYLGGSAFVSGSIQKIYSLSPEPPVCGHVPSNPERHTFYGSIRQDIPVFLTVRQRNTETPSDGVILPITLRQTVSRQGLHLPGQTMPAGTRYMEETAGLL